MKECLGGLKKIGLLIFILMPSSSQVVQLYIKHLHEIDHGGVEKKPYKLQSMFWVLGALRLLKNVYRQCIISRKLEAITGSQKMGEVFLKD